MRALHASLFTGLLLAAVAVGPARAQEGDVLRALAALPPEVGEALLVASQEQRLVSHVAALQARSSQQVAGLLRGLHPRDQAQVWALLSYPELAGRLVATGGSPAAVDEVLASYPEDIHDVARAYARTDLDLLAALAAIGERTEAEFGALVADEPVRVRSALRILVENPGAMALLERDRVAVARAGRRYRDDPDAVRAELAALRPTSAGRDADPEGVDVSPYADVADAYRARYAVRAPAYEAEPNTVVYAPRPYPYWYGYPGWYSGYGWHAALGWHLTPGVRAALLFGAPHPRVYAPYARFYVPHRRVYAPARRAAHPPRVTRRGSSPAAPGRQAPKAIPRRAPERRSRVHR